ncbi:MAG: hypothetical protein JNK82_37055 [Myxococcaceae bacterium]|nr:hypothetical protein [Myxococcaceae bacterium]
MTDGPAPATAAPATVAPATVAPATVAPATVEAAPAVPAPAVVVAPPPEPIDVVVRRILDAGDDAGALKTLASELGGARGELLALQLERPAGTPPTPREGELIAANHAEWAPPGTKAKVFERALPVTVSWEAATRADHAGWLSVESITCVADPTTPGSPLDGTVPRLKHLHRLTGAISDPQWRKLYKRVVTLHFRELDEALLKRLANTLPRFERLEKITFTESHVPAQDLATALVRAAPPKLTGVDLPAWGVGPRDVEAAVQAISERQVGWTLGLQVRDGKVWVRIGKGGATLHASGTPDRADVARARELLGDKGADAAVHDS